MSVYLGKEKSSSSKQALWILAFCVAYLAIQLFLIVRGHFVQDKRFAFWMFGESTYFYATLFRELPSGRRLKTRQGMWIASSESGRPKQYAWFQHVNEFRLDYLEKKTRAKTSISITLSYFQKALDYFADLVDDTETSRFVLEISYSKAGGPKVKRTLYSKRRLLFPEGPA